MLTGSGRKEFTVKFTTGVADTVSRSTETWEGFNRNKTSGDGFSFGRKTKGDWLLIVRQPYPKQNGRGGQV
jgi:hypothetical protein